MLPELQKYSLKDNFHDLFELYTCEMCGKKIPTIKVDWKIYISLSEDGHDLKPKDVCSECYDVLRFLEKIS